MTAPKVAESPLPLPPLIERWKAARIAWADAKYELAVAKAALAEDEANLYLAYREEGSTQRDADERVTIKGPSGDDVRSLTHAVDKAWAEAQALAYEIGLATQDDGQ